MLTPTSTFALRLAGQGAARASVASSIVRTTACPYSTASMKKQLPSTRLIGLAPASPLARTSAAFGASSPSSIVARVVRQPCSQRCNATAATAAQTKPAAAPGDKLDWETFFQLRKSRRRWQLGFSVISGLGAFVGGAGILATGVADPLVTQVPLDPFITMGLMTMAFGTLGWLVGPSIGSFVFYTLNKRWKNQMTIKEKEFFARIKKNRVDPSVSSVGNPVPDFYGEKISSVKGYRQWLKDQRAFNKKRVSFV
ncbi:mitochondrial import protein Pam17-domain-containing protein [Colletotrichum navitas]|uniref:Presequence translocated-associated motor subunit PAM17 n=1 Tax=Colletotrichum navitas TaxID=681940 RepID=A0AAD8Q4W6_9PEZI|nr:mitochondrial import protein Pam17-domain-containing protein [Colletotrichum navitas]KAK1595629.1 mitochondrial import protein Pam17-domain-containing protein [Colletotrichum navitas]